MATTRFEKFEKLSKAVLWALGKGWTFDKVRKVWYMGSGSERLFMFIRLFDCNQNIYRIDIMCRAEYEEITREETVHAT